MLSKACEYGIKACIYIAEQSDIKRKCGFEEIAKKINAPVAFLAKVLQLLVKKEIIHSQKGPNGGFYMEEDKVCEITVADIVIAIDGDKILKACILGMDKCDSDNPCALHNEFVSIRKSLNNTLYQHSLAQIIANKKN